MNVFRETDCRNQIKGSAQNFAASSVTCFSPAPPARIVPKVFRDDNSPTRDDYKKDNIFQKLMDNAKYIFSYKTEKETKIVCEKKSAPKIADDPRANNASEREVFKQEITYTSQPICLCCQTEMSTPNLSKFQFPVATKLNKGTGKSRESLVCTCDYDSGGDTTTVPRVFFSDDVSEGNQNECVNELSTIPSDKLDIMKTLTELATKEKKMKHQIEELQTREKTYKDVLKSFEQKASSPSPGMKPCTCNQSNLQDELMKISNEFKLENKCLKNELQEMKMELKHCLDRIEGPMLSKLEMEKCKCMQLQQDLSNQNQNMMVNQDSYMREMNSLKMQLCLACSNMSELNSINSKLKSELKSLDAMCSKLENDLVKQKLNEAETLKLMSRRMGPVPNEEPVKITKSQTKSEKCDENLHVIARKLSKTLRESAPCEECRKLPAELAGAAKCIKDLTDLVISRKATAPRKVAEATQMKELKHTSCQSLPVTDSEGVQVDSAQDSGVSNRCSCDCKCCRKESSRVNVQKVGESGEPERDTYSNIMTSADISSLKKESTTKDIPSLEKDASFKGRPAEKETKGIMRDIPSDFKSISSSDGTPKDTFQISFDDKPTFDQANDTRTEATIEPLQSGGGTVQQIPASAQFPYDVIIETEPLREVPSSLQVVTTITNQGTLEVISESPPGIITTVITITDEGTIEVHTEISESGNEIELSVNAPSFGDGVGSSTKKGDLSKTGLSFGDDVLSSTKMGETDLSETGVSFGGVGSSTKREEFDVSTIPQSLLDRLKSEFVSCECKKEESTLATSLPLDTINEGVSEMEATTVLPSTTEDMVTDISIGEKDQDETEEDIVEFTQDIVDQLANETTLNEPLDTIENQAKVEQVEVLEETIKEVVNVEEEIFIENTEPDAEIVQELEEVVEVSVQPSEPEKIEPEAEQEQEPEREQKQPQEQEQQQEQEPEQEQQQEQEQELIKTESSIKNDKSLQSDEIIAEKQSGNKVDYACQKTLTEKKSCQCCDCRSVSVLTSEDKETTTPVTEIQAAATMVSLATSEKQLSEKDLDTDQGKDGLTTDDKFHSAHGSVASLPRDDTVKDTKSESSGRGSKRSLSVSPPESKIPRKKRLSKTPHKCECPEICKCVVCSPEILKKRKEMQQELTEREIPDQISQKPSTKTEKSDEQLIEKQSIGEGERKSISSKESAEKKSKASLEKKSSSVKSAPVISSKISSKGSLKKDSSIHSKGDEPVISPKISEEKEVADVVSLKVSEAVPTLEKTKSLSQKSVEKEIIPEVVPVEETQVVEEKIEAVKSNIEQEVTEQSVVDEHVSELEVIPEEILIEQKSQKSIQEDVIASKESTPIQMEIPPISPKGSIEKEVISVKETEEIMPPESSEKEIPLGENLEIEVEKEISPKESTQVEAETEKTVPPQVSPKESVTKEPLPTKSQLSEESRRLIRCCCAPPEKKKKYCECTSICNLSGEPAKASYKSVSSKCECIECKCPGKMAQKSGTQAASCKSLPPECDCTKCDCPGPVDGQDKSEVLLKSTNLETRKSLDKDSITSQSCKIIPKRISHPKNCTCEKCSCGGSVFDVYANKIPKDCTVSRTGHPSDCDCKTCKCILQTVKEIAQMKEIPNVNDEKQVYQVTATECCCDNAENARKFRERSKIPVRVPSKADRPAAQLINPPDCECHLCGCPQSLKAEDCTCEVCFCPNSGRTRRRKKEPETVADMRAPQTKKPFESAAAFPESADCDCDTCECNPCADPKVNAAKVQETSKDCICPICTCSTHDQNDICDCQVCDCEEDNFVDAQQMPSGMIQKITATPAGQTPSSPAIKGGCTCESCMCMNCKFKSTPSSPKVDATKPQASSGHPDGCNCSFCQCSPCHFMQKKTVDKEVQGTTPQPADKAQQAPHAITSGVQVHSPNCVCPVCTCEPGAGAPKSQNKQVQQSHPAGCTCDVCRCSPCTASGDKSMQVPSQMTKGNAGHPSGCLCDVCKCSPCAAAGDKSLQVPSQLPSGPKGHFKGCTCKDCSCPCGDSGEKSLQVPSQTAGHPPGCMCSKCVCNPCTPNANKEVQPSMAHLSGCLCVQCKCNPCGAQTGTPQANIQPQTAASGDKAHPADCKCASCVCSPCIPPAAKTDAPKPASDRAPDCTCVECVCNPCAVSVPASMAPAVAPTASSAPAGTSSNRAPDCQCTDCKCNPCTGGTSSPSKSSPKDTEGKGDVKFSPSTSGCTCTDCKCTICPGKDGASGAGKAADSKPVASKPSVGISESHYCSCIVCACDVCTNDRNKNETKKDLPKLPQPDSKKALDGPHASVDTLLHEHGTVIKGCNCPICRCPPEGKTGGGDIGKSSERAQPGGQAGGFELAPVKACDCGECKCPICARKGGSSSPPKEPPQQSSGRPDMFDIGPVKTCDCGDCKCIICSRKGPAAQTTGTSRQIAPMAPCECKNCKCTNCPRKKSGSQAAASGPPPFELKERMHCDCPTCTCITCSKMGPSASKKAPMQSVETCTCGNCKCEVCTKMDKQSKKMNAKAMKGNCMCHEEVTEIMNALNKIKCACTEAEVKALETGGGFGKNQNFGSTMSGLKMALTSLQQKCKAKDKMIAYMAQELQMRTKGSACGSIPSDKLVDYDRGEDVALMGRYKHSKRDHKHSEKGHKSKKKCKCSEASSSTKLNLSGFEIIDIRRVTENSLLIKWNPPKSNLLMGYDIFVNGVHKSKVLSSDRTNAMIHNVTFQQTSQITVYAVTKQGRCEPPAIAIFEI